MTEHTTAPAPPEPGTAAGLALALYQFADLMAAGPADRTVYSATLRWVGFPHAVPELEMLAADLDGLLYWASAHSVPVHIDDRGRVDDLAHLKCEPLPGVFVWKLAPLADAQAWCDHLGVNLSSTPIGVTAGSLREAVTAIGQAATA